MTDANPAFDTVHPGGHILVRSCRGGYMHSVALSEEAMQTDAETLARGILLTADVSGRGGGVLRQQLFNRCIKMMRGRNLRGRSVSGCHDFVADFQ
jgi:hypothetical protein